jgi:formate hydrogenlyase subunit 6/NADH:ubiquinone oxidoreductase subunit I
MYCGVCAEGCSRSAIEMSNQWLLAGVTKDALLRTYSVRRLQKKKPAMKPTEVPPNA